MALKVTDEWTQYDVLFFYQPSWRKYVAFLRFPRGHPLYPRFIARVRRIAVAVTLRYRYCRRADTSRNLIAEVKARVLVEHTAWENFKSDDQMRDLLKQAEDEALSIATEALTFYFGAEVAAEAHVVGVTYYVVDHPQDTPRAREWFRLLGTGKDVDEYLIYHRCTEAGRITKTRDLTRDWQAQLRWQSVETIA